MTAECVEKMLCKSDIKRTMLPPANGPLIQGLFSFDLAYPAFDRFQINIVA